ncbi:MAG: phage tail tip lysozyme [Proteobacteria bacterium]|nr:phage tail tip lysozyme [Pseudomonadota bacterium]
MKLLSGFVLLGMLAGACVTEVDAYETPDDSDLPPEGSEAALTNGQRTAYNFFVSKGLTPKQSAGIVGNLMQESSVSPTAVEYGGGPGRGIAQWGVGARWDVSRGDNVMSYAAGRGVSRWALTTQLDFIWYELATVGGYGLAELRAATTVASAVRAFQDKFEKCGTCAASKRLTYANQVLAAYGNTTPTPTPDPTPDPTDPTAPPTPTPAGTTCHSATLDMDVPQNTCVQASSDGLWYQCSDGAWVDRYSDPEPCSSIHPL